MRGKGEVGAEGGGGGGTGGEVVFEGGGSKGVGAVGGDVAEGFEDEGAFEHGEVGDCKGRGLQVKVVVEEDV